MRGGGAGGGQADLARKVAARWGVPKVYASHEEMLAREDLDGLVAAQPFTRHGTLIPELLRHGKPVLTEKPIAGSVAQGEKIVEAMEAAHTWMMIGYHKRSDPATMLAKAEIDGLKVSGELGRMTYVRILMPAGDWIAVSSSWSQTNGQPSAWLLKRPTAAVPSQLIAPIKPVPARKRF